MEKLVNRFLRYVSVDTQSAEDKECVPSTEKQHVLAQMLCEELQAMGYEAEHDAHAYVYATIPGNRTDRAYGHLPRLQRQGCQSEDRSL